MQCVSLLTAAGLPGLPESPDLVLAWLRQRNIPVFNLPAADEVTSVNFGRAVVALSCLPEAARAGLELRIRAREEDRKRRAEERLAQSASRLAELEAHLDAAAARAMETPAAEETNSWATLSVISKLALAQLAGKGLRLSAEQVSVLASHLELRSAA